MTTKASKLLFAWRWALCSEWGPKNATDRHVALVLSLYMKSDGVGAWPSQTTLAARTGLTARSVRDALHRLVKGKWLARTTRKPRRGRSAKGFGFDYTARLPRVISAMYWSGNAEAASLFRGRDPFRQKPIRRGKSNTEIRDHQIRKHVPTNALVERSMHAYKKGFGQKKPFIIDDPEQIASYAEAFARNGVPA